MNLSPLRIAGLYLLFACVWIIGSDAMLDYILSFFPQLTPKAYTNLQTLKGLAFVFITGALLYFLIQKYGNALLALLQTERQLAQRFSHVTDNMTDVISLHEPNSRLLYITPSVQRVLGFRPEELLNMDPFSRLDPQDVKTIILPGFEALRKGGTMTQVRYKMRHKANHWVWVESHARPIYDDSGKIIQVLLESRDVTERVSSEQELQRLVEELRASDEELRQNIEEITATQNELALREARLQAVLNTVADGIVTINERGIIQSVNPAVCRTFGYEAKELLGQNVSILAGGAHGAAHDSYIANYHRTGEAKIIGIGRQVPGRRKDGSEFPLYLAISETEVNGQRLFTGVLHDMTETVARERELQQLVEELKSSDEELRQNIEEMQATQNELALRKARLLAVLNTVADGIVSISERGIIQSINPAVTRTFGYTAEELVGQNVSLLAGGGLRDAHDGYISNYNRTGEAKIIGIGRQVMGRRKDGTEFPLYLAIGETEVNGQRIFTGVMHDMTELLDRQQAVNELSSRLKNLLDRLSDGFYLLDPELRFLIVNQTFTNITGLTINDVGGKRFGDVFPFTISRPIYALLNAALADGKPHQDETYYPEYNTWFFVSIYPLPDGSVAVFSENTTERNLMRQQLEASEGRYRELFNASPQPMWVFDEDTLKFLEVNDAAVTKYGYTREEFLQMTLLDIRPLEDRPAFLLHAQSQTATHMTRDVGVWRHMLKDGTIIEVLVRASPLRFGGRKAQIAMTTDVTQQLKAQRQIAESEARYRLLAENASDFIFTLDTSFHIAYASPAIVHITGIPPVYVQGQTLGELFTPETALPDLHDDTPPLIVFQGQLLHATLAEGPWVEVHLRRAHPGAEISTSKVAYIGSCHNIDERRQYEKERRDLEALKQQELVMAAIEAQEAERKRIAEDLHDDLGHLLTGVYFILQKLNETLPEGSPDNKRSHEASDLMEQAVTVTRNITRSLVPYALYNSGIENAISFLCSNINRVGKVHVEFHAYLNAKRYAPAVETTVYRVCQELLNNSMKYSKCEEITVQLFEEDQVLYLEVSDDGVGFDYAAAVATESLGLKNIAKRVQALGGSHHVETAPGKGTTTFIEVPCGLMAPAVEA